jgi:hypothetical protein
MFSQRYLGFIITEFISQYSAILIWFSNTIFS